MRLPHAGTRDGTTITINHWTEIVKTARTCYLFLIVASDPFEDASRTQSAWSRKTTRLNHMSCDTGAQGEVLLTSPERPPLGRLHFPAFFSLGAKDPITSATRRPFVEPLEFCRSGKPLTSLIRAVGMLGPVIVVDGLRPRRPQFGRRV